MKCQHITPNYVSRVIRHFVNAQSGYIQKYTNRPLNGYHCVHGHYASIAEISLEYCLHIYLRNRKCASLSFNEDTNSCHLSQVPCAVAEAQQGFLLNFQWNEDENCIAWKTNGLEIGGIVPERLVEDFGSHHSAVGRIQIGGNFYVGVIGRPTEDGYGYFLIDGNEHYEDNQYKLLTVRPNCSLAWMPYRAGDTQPKRAVVAGYLSGVGFTYIIQVWRHEVNSMKYGVYVTGNDFAQYPYYGVQYVKDVEILVQVWLISEHPHSHICAFCIVSSLKKAWPV